MLNISGRHTYDKLYKFRVHALRLQAVMPSLSRTNFTSVTLRPALTGTCDGISVDENVCLVRVTDLASLANLLKPKHVALYTECTHR